MHRRDDAQVEPEIRVERDYLSACRAALARMREEAVTALATGKGEGDAFDKMQNFAARQFHKKQIEELSGLDDVPLFFGRLDFPLGDVYDEIRSLGSPSDAPDSDRVYIGRRGVSDEAGELMVIDWRAPLSRAFYEASAQEPMRVRVRRRFGFDHGGELTAFEDESLDERFAQADGGDLLAAEIERPRKGPMRDIVATIQPEQMSLVRAPLERTLCVQGAPGTGKTAVGLHRLAYLLFTERERLRREGGVAVIGPNRAFLAYVRNVLPALGEVEVLQTTIDELTDAGVAVTRAEDPGAQRIKGDARMAEVIRRHLWSRIRPVEETVRVKHLQRTWHLYSDEIADELAAVRERGTDYRGGSELLAQRLALLVVRQMERGGHSVTASTPTQLRRNRAIVSAVQRMWPETDAVRAVFELLTDSDLLARAADGLLSAEEQLAVLVRPRPRGPKGMRWASSDLALIDEAAAMIERPAKLGHIVVDEAQDLSPMQIRAIGRRVAGACTVLGDLAQATSPSAAEDWAAVLGHLGRPDGQIEELTRGYRVPAQVIDYAARLLPHIAPELRGPASYRQSADALVITRAATEQMSGTIVGACARALTEEGSVGLIAADRDIPELHRLLTENGLGHVILGTDETGIDSVRLSLVPVTLAKGLEFDTVLVVEPARIAESEERGLQRLYVALTRAVSSLRVIHADDLPEPLVREPALC
ncbi:DNA helicase IV [Nocardia tenerifensis]|uniref:DNA helicase IV n=1 Tax=Nocardia tenerifensis TaxID=228006 RepID=A0A318JVV7_9NOCA|nr:ATP-binding domain-containing protein [Nocardia tenerifensis]PXX61101.1 DNA helicase IV [Nocardia tenerifensis]